MKKYFITGNAGKFREVQGKIQNLEMLPIKDLPEIQSLDIREIIEYKLRAAVKELNGDYIAIVEDTGLYLNAMNGFPGPLIKFLLKTIGNEGIYKICSSLGNFDAVAITAFGLYNSEKESIEFFEGKMEGKITSPKGTHGFGWDPIFIPTGSEKTYAEMETIEDKDSFSMRFSALKKLLEKIEQL